MDLILFLNIIIARLLTPSDYGLIGIIMVFFVVAHVFVDSGLGTAYIQKTHVSEKDANTIFIFNLLVSIFAYSILWFSAPLVSHFYEQPLLVNLIRVMGLVIIINAFSIVQIAQLTRDLDFKRKTKIALFSVLFSGALGIVAALNGFGVWSLVIQNIANRFAMTIGLWITSKWKPRLQFSMISFNEMFSFGSWILMTGLIRTTFNNIYVLVIGKIFPIAQLGFYTKAKQLQQISSTHILSAIGTVSLPVFSSLKDDNTKLQNSTKKFLQHTLLLMVPISTILFVVAKPFVILLLTEKWGPMIPYLQLLCIVGILLPIHAINVKILLAQGKSRLNFNLSLLKNGLRILNLIIMARHGIIYIIIGEIVLSFIAIIINTFYTHKYIDYGFIKQTKDVYKIFIAAILAALFGLSLNLISSNLWLLLIGGVALTGFLYLIILAFIDGKLMRDTLNLRNMLVK